MNLDSYCSRFLFYRLFSRNLQRMVSVSIMGQEEAAGRGNGKADLASGSSQGGFSN